MKELKEYARSKGIVLKGVLNKTINAAWIQVDPENQKLPLGGSNSSLANIKGKMVANMGEGLWNNFIFSGEMQGFKGMQGDTRKTFIVTGSINANNEKIEVKNIPSGFGNIGLTYDIANSRFTGNLQLDKTMGPLSIAGTANLLVDPGGWYFLAGGKVQSPGLEKQKSIELKRITKDHSLVEELVQAGEITEEEANVHPRRSVITRALGIEDSVEVEITPIDFKLNDRYLLCSDGLTSMVRDDEILNLSLIHI